MSEIKLDMRLKQALRISPQILQSTQILQMNAQDLREYVDRVLEENPVLDKAPEHEAQREFQELCRQAGWISGQGVRSGSSSGEDPYRPEAGAWDAAMTSLPAFLSDQLDRKALSKPLRELCRYLVQALDEDGFLEQEDIDAVCELGVPDALVQQAVSVLQELEPAGVAARNLEECLLLQLRRMPEDTTLAQRIMSGYLPLLGKKRWHALAEKLGVSEQEVQQAATLISGLSPHPGRMETTETISPEYITPDVFIVERGDALEVVLNDFYVPQIRINGYYAALLTDAAGTVDDGPHGAAAQNAGALCAADFGHASAALSGHDAMSCAAYAEGCGRVDGRTCLYSGALYSREASAMPPGNLSAAIPFPSTGRRRGALLGAGCPGQAGAVYQGGGSAPSPQRPAAQ